MLSLGYTGPEKKWNKVSVKVSVLSDPFSPVQFESSSYSKTLPEDASKGSTIFIVKASRSGSESGITYSIVGGDPGKTFKIDDSNRGNITLAKALDYESKKNYKLIIRATFSSPGNVPDVTAEVTGEVTVTDVNDNKPRFLLYKSVTRIAIDSYSPSGTTVFQVHNSLTESAIPYSSSSQYYSFIYYMIIGHIIIIIIIVVDVAVVVSAIFIKFCHNMSKSERKMNVLANHISNETV